MLEMPVDRKMSRSDIKYVFSNIVPYCKWLDKCSVTVLLSNVEGMTIASTVPHQQKGPVSKTQVPCPDAIELYNQGMLGVDLIDQRAAAYHLDRKSTIRFYSSIFLDLMDLACANLYIIYNMMHPNDLTLFDFKTTISIYLI